MNREEIRKKWKNRELAEISQKKLARQEDTQVSPTKNVSQGSSWKEYKIQLIKFFQIQVK